MTDLTDPTFVKLMDRLMGHLDSEDNIQSQILKRLWIGPRPKEESQGSAILDARNGTTVTRARAILENFCSTDFFAKREMGTIELQSSNLVVGGEKKTRVELEWKPKATSLLAKVEALWHEYVLDDAGTFVISTEPTVFSDPDRRFFIRFLDINARPGDKELQTEIAAFIATQEDDASRAFFTNLLLGRPEAATPCYHYQPSGEVLAALEFEQFFNDEARVNPDRKWQCKKLLSQRLNPLKYKPHHEVILGNCRTNTVISQLQAAHSHYPFRMNARSIDYQTKSFIDGPRSVFCLVSRYLDSGQNKLKTVVAAHNGRGIQTLAGVLTSDSGVEHLRKKLGVSTNKDLRRVNRFQALYEVSINSDNGDGGNATLLDCILL